MISFRAIFVRMMAAAVVLSLTVPAAALAVPAVPQGESAASWNENFFEILERGDFSETTVSLEEGEAVQLEAEIHGMGCTLVRYFLDGQTLLRIEYYDADGGLVFLSEVLDFDAASRSYTEKFYRIDPATDARTLLRTDTYAEGALTKQVVHTEMPKTPAKQKMAPEARTASKEAVSGQEVSAPVPAAAEPVNPPTATEPAKVPVATEAAKIPAASEPVKAPVATEPAETPAAAEPAKTPAATESVNPPAAAAPPKTEIAYDHTTSIYTNDEKTLLRVEYYNSENKLAYYSSVEGYDNDTKSYTENIYRYDWDTQTEILERTDVYVNGQLQGGNP